jgi:hypothetical protein
MQVTMDELKQIARSLKAACGGSKYIKIMDLVAIFAHEYLPDEYIDAKAVLESKETNVTRFLTSAMNANRTIKLDILSLNVLNAKDLFSRCWACAEQETVHVALDGNMRLVSIKDPDASDIEKNILCFFKKKGALRNDINGGGV